MKKLLLFILLIVFPLLGGVGVGLNAQSLQWANNFGCANDSSSGYGIAHDKVGNCIAIGDFYGTVDFDPGTGVSNLSTSNYYVCYLAKYDANGNFLWAFSLGNGGNNYSHGASACTDKNGNIIITGDFGGTIDFNPGSGSNFLVAPNYGDIFVAKYDANGNFLWAHNYGGSGNYGNFGGNICTDTTGNVLVCGAFQGTADFNPGAGVNNLTAIGDNDIFIAKYDTSGNYVWAFSIPSSTNLYNGAQGLSTDVSGNVFVGGYIESAADFDPSGNVHTLTPYGGQDVFLAKYNSNGNYLWAFNLGAASRYSQAVSVSVDATGNAFLTGGFQGTLDFNPGTATNNLTSHSLYQDIFLAKYDSSGNYLWAFQIGSGGPHYNYGFSVSNDGSNPIISGCFGGTADFDPSSNIQLITSLGSYDIFLAKYDANGNYIWAFDIGSSTSTTGYYSYIGYSCSADANGNVWLTGWIQNNNNDFDPNAGTHYLNVPAGEQDIFIAKYAAAPTAIKQITNSSEQIIVYPNPNNGDFLIDAKQNKGQLIIYNSLGEKVFETNAENNLVKINLQQSGVYQIVFKTEEEIFTKKIIVAN